MPLLTGFFDPAAEAPGFILPLFKFDKCHNATLVQKIDINDRIIAFDDCDPPGLRLEHESSSIILNVGDSALWAFKDEVGLIYLGDTKRFGSVAKELLESKKLNNWPLIQLELESFRRPGKADPNIVRAAFFDIVEKSGELAAEVWRDTELFAPAFRRDAKKHLSSETNTARMQSAIVLYQKGSLNIIVDPAIKQICENIEFEEVKYILKVFDLLDSILIRTFSSLRRYSEQHSSWNVRGIGGVARFVLGKYPFRGAAYSFGSGEEEIGVEASGVLSKSGLKYKSDSQFIAVCQSTFGHFSTMRREVENFPPSIFRRHLINVRPFNFGNLPARRVALNEVQTLAAGFDHIWIIGGHRQRKTGNYRNQLSITNMASRLVKNALISIIKNHEVILEISDELPQSPSVNTFGSARIFRDLEGEALYLKLLHSMLDEEVLLHSAKRIIFLSPIEIRSRVERLTLGEQTYLVEIVPSGRVDKTNNIFGWALSVNPRQNGSDEFRDFCISILSGYVTTRRDRDQHVLVLDSESRKIFLRTAHSDAALQEIIDHSEARHGYQKNIITREKFDKKTFARAQESGFNILHYSEIPGWLKMVIK